MLKLSQGSDLMNILFRLVTDIHVIALGSLGSLWPGLLRVETCHTVVLNMSLPFVVHLGFLFPYRFQFSVMLD